jgi:hypothetical protein
MNNFLINKENIIKAKIHFKRVRRYTNNKNKV